MATNEIRRKRQRTETKHGAPSGCEAVGMAGRVLVLITCALVPTCDPADGEGPAAAFVVRAGPDGGAGDTALVDVETFEEAFQVTRRLVLEESAEAMTVLPMVSPGAPGELLLAEPREGQVNVYDTAGRLRRVVGGRGEGPGEFHAPIAARRTLDGGMVVTDPMLSRLTFLSPGEERDPEVAPSPLPLVVDAQDLGDGRYLVAGRSLSDPRPGLLHIWDRETGEIERSFMPDGVARESRAYAASFSAVGAVTEADTIWAVWALADTLFKFDRSGRILDRLPLSLPTPIGALPGAEAGVITDPRAIQAAAESITQVTGVFLLGDGALAVQAMRARAFDAVWDLLIVDRRGARAWGAPRMPRLYAVVGDLFYFDDPSSLLPNHWIVATRRGED